MCFACVVSSLTSEVLRAAPSAHSLLPHGPHICDRWDHIPGDPESYPAACRGPHKRPALTLGFLACCRLQEEDPKEPATVSHPGITQPLRVLLAWVGADSRSTTTNLDPRPAAAGKNKKEQRPRPSRPVSDSAARPNHYLLKDEVRRLRRHMRRYKEEMLALRRRISRLEHADDGHCHYLWH